MIDFYSYDYYIKPGFTDMRKGARGLAILVQNEMALQPFSKAVFIFCGQSRKTVKAIVWDRNGWFEIIKRLECRESFKWPITTEQARHVTFDQIKALLDGHDAFREFPRYHPVYV